MWLATRFAHNAGSYPLVNPATLALYKRKDKDVSKKTPIITLHQYHLLPDNKIFIADYGRIPHQVKFVAFKSGGKWSLHVSDKNLTWREILARVVKVTDVAVIRELVAAEDEVYQFYAGAA